MAWPVTRGPAQEWKCFPLVEGCFDLQIYSPRSRRRALYAQKGTLGAGPCPQRPRGALYSQPQIRLSFPIPPRPRAPPERRPSGWRPERRRHGNIKQNRGLSSGSGGFRRSAQGPLLAWPRNVSNILAPYDLLVPTTKQSHKPDARRPLGCSPPRLAQEAAP